jgi:protein-glutamine gamma-glutamyltransferase
LQGLNAVSTSGSPHRSHASRLIDPLKRLFGPQMSSGARERRDVLVLLLAVALVVLPHFEHLPWWTTALLVLMLFWRGFLTVTQHPLPGRMLMVPLLLGAGFGVYLQHGTLVGQQAGVTFLLLLMALKLLEMRARRDVFVVIFLSFFILLTQFMHSQELPVAVMTLLAVAALFFVLVSVHLDDADLPATRKMGMVGWSLLKAIPLTAVLFVLFPRISGPLWGMPGDSTQGSTGLSNSMAPGSISRLLESNDIAFRVKFGGETPAGDRLYWRGPVFGSFNGRTWSPLSQRRADPTPLTIEADPGSLIEYTVTLEPHQNDWLFGLEAPASMPDLPGLGARLTSEMQLLANDLIRERTRYTMRSHTSFSVGRNASRPELEDWLPLPETFNPRTMQFAEDLRRRLAASGPTTDSGPELRLVRAVIEHFRSGGYEYSLAPPRLGRHSVDEFLFDTRQGYCEHYASAFVVLMRALRVPARVVTGYQGGELNPVDGFMTIRQSDAHAWTEVWLADRGWVRVDPTAAVAPVRIDRGALEAARQSGSERTGAFRDGRWLRAWLHNWEAVQNGWNQWVLSYSQERQRAFVEMLGLAPRWESAVAALAVAVGILMIGMALSTFHPRTVRDPLGETYRLLRAKLEQAGVPTAEHVGPRELYARTRQALPREDAQQARKLLSRYERMRYSRSAEGVAPADIRALKRAVRGFTPGARAPNEP